jgi:hypothetical protein
MAKIEQYSRIINHAISTSGSVFTVPTSNDHTDETWLATDLYVGEFGVNVTDDKVYVRTSNGIIPVATGSTGSGTGASILVFNSPNINIGTTYSANSLSPNGVYYTDLGTSANRWKDIYLGGSATTKALIDVNQGVAMSDVDGGILVTNDTINTGAPIEVDTSSNTNKARVLNLNSRVVTNTGSTNYNVTIASQTVTMNDASKAVVIAGSNVSIDGLSNVVHLGKGYSKDSYESDQITVGGSLAIRGTDDDGSTQYITSDWVTKQSKLRTSNALMNDLATIAWFDASLGGEVVQVKAQVLATDIYNPALVYSAEISGVYSINDALSLFEIGTPIVLEWDSFVQNGYAIPTVEIGSDASGVYVKAQGNATSTIQWLCTYSYHRLVNVL